MLNVLQTQLYRLKKSKLFWALFIEGVYDLMGNILDSEAAGMLDAMREEGGALTLSSLGKQISLGSDAMLFSIICSSIFLSGEFSGGAIRNMILANKSRTQIFLSFLSVSLIIGFSYLGVSYASTLLCYGALIGFGGVTVNQVFSGCFSTLFLALITVALAQSCVCLFLFFTRKTGPTVAFPIVLVIFAPSLISTIVDLVIGLKMLTGQEIPIQNMGWIPLYNMNLFDAANIDGGLVGKIALYNIPLAALLATLGWVASKKDMK